MLRIRVKHTLFSVAALAALSLAHPAQAVDLGVEGQVYEVIEEDFRVTLMRLVARHDWSTDQEELKESAQDYTKNLPSYMLPRADVTRTRWKDVGIVVSEDIYLPWVDWQSGSVFAPGKVLAAQAGTYLNPIAKMPAAGIERLFIFDGTDPAQMSFARELLKQNVEQLSFMMIAGDVGELSSEVGRPIYHPAPSMLEKFHVEAVPTLIGFGRGPHQGHMAITEIKLPADSSVVKEAWFGLGDAGEVAPPQPAVLTETTPAADQQDAQQDGATE
ncbi:conjugal transfer pilus assembly protein TraW [Novimethylophilus kurashikiensis]|uniref:Conjugal transfer pilus assembly protein TraW n=1 Tax=Novimethylophilus kurashikiensis TaxID=1825523 RepID=A0A2R5FAD5_9PROT|nr:hypothetical protein [Novimethylophilus kurashikiensis]GBG14508.1 conjugal transfer pilus assembly protein TraW [Novimethylophilus kurashikiensis]